jgi:hypothetical protein
MSKVFKAKKSTHSNAVEEEEYKSLSENIDRGCFGVELTSPTIGEKVSADKQYTVQIRKFIHMLTLLSTHTTPNQNVILLPIPIL